MSKAQRAKGQRVERDIADSLQIFFDLEVKRTLGQERDSGTDIHVGPFAIEVKGRKQRVAVQKFLEQAEAGAHAGEIAVAIIKADREVPIVVMTLPDWCAVVYPYFEIHQEHRGSRRG